MPIDFKKNYTDQTDLTDAFLRSRNIPGELAATRSNVMADRAKFTDALSGTVGRTAANSGLAAPVPYSPDTSRLQNNLNLNQAKQKFQGGRNQLSLLQERITSQLTDAGYDRRTAEAYAAQYVQDVLQRQNVASQGAKDRASKVRMADAADSYASRGLSIESQYQPDSGVSAALARVLAGGVSAGLTAYGLYGRSPKPSIPVSNPNTYTGIGPGQDQGYYPQRPDFLVPGGLNYGR